MKKLSVLAALVVLMLVAGPAMAHNWGCWIQPDRTVTYRISGSNSSLAQAAVNEWDADTILTMVSSSSNDILVSDGNYGNTGWGGLATIQQYSGCTILYGTAVLNTFYSYTANGKRGVFCQEVGHLFGLDHSNDGGCMGGGYYYSIDTNYNVVSHNIKDIGNKYRNVPASLLFKHGDEHGEGDSPAVHAVWYHNPRTLGEVAALSSKIVVAEVASVVDSADIVVRMAGMPNDEHRVPTQRIGLNLKGALKGEMPSTFDLFHTGNESFALDRDPAYAVGEKYILFLTEREDGTYLVVSPEGRFKINGWRLQAMSDKEFAVKLQAVGLPGLKRDLAEVLAAPATH